MKYLFYSYFLLSLTSSLEAIVILISFDGFRHDYIETHNLYNIKQFFQDSGVIVKNGLKNAFTTVTFPNHFTLATGLYPETHGIVANAMFDPQLNESFYAFGSKDNDTKWFGQNNITIPIWILNQLQGGKSAVIGGFPGVNVPFRNQTVFYSEDYNNTLGWYDKVNNLIDLILYDRINLGVLYFPEPDETGHEFGPYSPEIGKVLKEIDLLIGFLVTRLQVLGLWGLTNIIITSDHGMDTASYEKSIDLSDYVDISLFKSYGGLTQINIFPNDEKDLDFIYERLKNVPNYNVFKHDDVPDRFNYKNNGRIGPIVMFGDVGYETFRTGRNKFNWDHWKGDHGGDNEVLSMHPVFMARGPVFKKNYTSTKLINSVDVYPLICHILEIKHDDINGTMENITDLLLQKKVNIGVVMDNLINMAFIILVLFLVMLFLQIRVNFLRRNYLSNRNKVLVSSLSSTRLV